MWTSLVFLFFLIFAAASECRKEHRKTGALRNCCSVFILDSFTAHHDSVFTAIGTGVKGQI